MHAVIFGASRGVGYSVLRSLLSQADWSVSVLVRTPANLESDPAVVEHIKTGRLKVFKGDAFNAEDVKPLFMDKVDVVVSSMGSMAFRITTSGVRFKGPQDPCTGPMRVLLEILKDTPTPPRVVAVSTMGCGESHHAMPWLHRIAYPFFLNGPHADKEGMEYLLARASSVLPSPKNSVETYVLDPKIAETTPETFLPEHIVVRPAAFVGGDEPNTLRELKKGEAAKVWTVGRGDVARFIVDECLPGNDQWVNKKPIVGF